MKTEAFEYKVKEQLSNSCGINGLLARCKNYPLHEAMVNHDHDRIKSCRRREVSDEVNRQLFKRKGDSGLDRKQGRDNRVCVGFVLLANGAAGDKVFHKGGETQPPEIPFQDGFGMKDPHVS